MENHISERDLERYHLGLVLGQFELAAIEEHLLRCPACMDLAEERGHRIDIVRAAAVLASNE